MSLENAIEELTTALKAHTTAMYGVLEQSKQCSVPTATVAEKAEAPSQAEKKPAKEKVKAEPVKEVPVESTVTEEPEQEPDPVSAEDQATTQADSVLPTGVRDEKYYTQHIQKHLMEAIKSRKDGGEHVRGVINSYKDAEGKVAANFKLIPTEFWDEAFTRIVGDASDSLI